MPGAKQQAADILSWAAMVLGVLLGVWSIYNTATRPKPNELDVIDLLLDLVIAGTLVVVTQPAAAKA